MPLLRLTAALTLGALVSACQQAVPVAPTLSSAPPVAAEAAKGVDCNAPTAIFGDRAVADIDGMGLSGLLDDHGRTAPALEVWVSFVTPKNAHGAIAGASVEYRIARPEGEIVLPALPVRVPPDITLDAPADVPVDPDAPEDVVPAGAYRALQAAALQSPTRELASALQNAPTATGVNATFRFRDGQGRDVLDATGAPLKQDVPVSLSTERSSAAKRFDACTVHGRGREWFNGTGSAVPSVRLSPLQALGRIPVPLEGATVNLRVANVSSFPAGVTITGYRVYGVWAGPSGEDYQSEPVRKTLATPVLLPSGSREAPGPEGTVPVFLTAKDFVGATVDTRSIAAKVELLDEFGLPLSNGGYPGYGDRDRVIANFLVTLHGIARY